MPRHFFTALSITLLIACCMFLPYCKGEYDSLATTLSFMAQVLSFALLILVPLGIVWLVYEFRRVEKFTENSRTVFYFEMGSLIACFLIGLAIAFSVLLNNLSVGVITIVLLIYGFTKVLAKIRSQQNSWKRKFNPVPVYLIVIPLILIFIRFSFMETAAVFARDLAIKNSGQLIKDIEYYYQKNGHYPPSMLSLWKDYKPSVVGIKQYHYELNGQAYNLYFESPSAGLAAKEIVMYNKLGEQEMTSHDEDLLLLSAAELNQQRGYISVHKLPQPNWKSFLFD